MVDYVRYPGIFNKKNMDQPKEKRFTSTHDNFRFDMITGNTPLLDAGLTGPVKLLKTKYL